jgi:hypothetical protein
MNQHRRSLLKLIVGLPLLGCFTTKRPATSPKPTDPDLSQFVTQLPADIGPPRANGLCKLVSDGDRMAVVHSISGRWYVIARNCVPAGMGFP